MDSSVSNIWLLRIKFFEHLCAILGGQLMFENLCFMIYCESIFIVNLIFMKGGVGKVK